MTMKKSDALNLLLRWCLGAILAAALPACQSLPQAHSAKKTRVTHVVVVWLKHHGSGAERRKLIEASQSFKTIPGITGITVGPVLPSLRPGVDSSFDVAVVFGFESEKARTDYDGNPIHQQAVKQVLAPLASKYVIYDFVNK